MKKEWIAGVYIRLSLEDGDDKEESNSVTNQRGIIMEFLKQYPEIKVYDIYVDDGFTGTNFERPSFKRMLQDWMAKDINTIIVKDLSRFGRNYLGVGSYIQELFPTMQTRFIAINDKIDSYLRPESIYDIEVPFKNIMNEAYSKDISKKVKSVLAMKQRDGEYVGSPPFGYERNPDDKAHLIPHPEEAVIVQKIFKWYLKDNMARSAIVRKLNESHIDTKMTRIRTKRGDKNIPKNYWCVRTIDGMLKNQVYIGNTVSNKYLKTEKSRKHKRLPSSEWKIVKNTHPAIISEKDFFKVQEKLKEHSYQVSKREETIYANKLVCGDCGRTMIKFHVKTSWGEPADWHYYKCKTYTHFNYMDCTPHRIRQEKLNNIVLKAIKMHIALAFSLEKVINEVNNRNGKKQIDSSKNKMKANIRTTKELIENEKTLKKKRYEEMKNGIINLEEFKKLSEESNLKISNLENEIKIYQENISKLEIDERTSDILINEVTKYADVTELNRNLMDFFVEKVSIYEKDRVSIDFKFSDEFEKAIEYIKNVNKYLNIVENFTYE